MGLLDKLRRKKDETVEKVKEQQLLSLPIPLMQNRLLAKGSKSILLKENQSMNKSSFYKGYSFLTASRSESLSPRNKSDKALRYCTVDLFGMIKE
jgi:hypothetical protein